MKKLITLFALIFGLSSLNFAQNGLQFNGGQNVQTSCPGVLGSADRTFEAWVFVPSSAPASNLCILDYGINAVGSRNTFAISGSRQVSFISGGTNANMGSTAGAVPEDQWVHVAFVMKNSIGFVYVNGIEVGTGNLSTVNTPAGNENVKIGQRVAGGSIPFFGAIDEVRIWDVARTPAEIQAGLNANLCPPVANLLLYVQLNEGIAGGTNTGNISAPDASGNGFNGVLNNFALTGTTSNWVTGVVQGSGDNAANVSISACDSFSLLPSSTVYTTSGTYTEVLPGANVLGCDSTVTLTLTINNTTFATDVVSACDSITWIDGVLYTSNNNTATHTITNAAGCDSIVTLNLTVNSNTSGVDVQTVCDSLTWVDGNTYTADNNTATFTLTSSTGCDSMLTLDLTILNSSTTTDTQTACDSLIWIDGNTYSSSNNTASFTLTNAVGCDSVVTLDLTILNSSNLVDVQSSCDAFTWINGNTYTMNNNTASVILTNSAGCDSIITLNLTIEPISTNVTQTGATLTADQTGASYQWLECPGLAAISGATNATFSPTANGDYAVLVSNSACSDTSICYTVTTVGIIENDFGKTLQVYPNPTIGNFSIDLGKSYGETNITITDVTGRVVLSNTYSSSDLLNIELNEPTGVYLLHVQSADKNAWVRVVKK